MGACLQNVFVTCARSRRRGEKTRELPEDCFKLDMKSRGLTKDINECVESLDCWNCPIRFSMENGR